MVFRLFGVEVDVGFFLNFNFGGGLGGGGGGGGVFLVGVGVGGGGVFDFVMGVGEVVGEVSVFVMICVGLFLGFYGMLLGKCCFISLLKLWKIW